MVSKNKVEIDINSKSQVASQPFLVGGRYYGAGGAYDVKSSSSATAALTRPSKKHAAVRTAERMQEQVSKDEAEVERDIQARIKKFQAWGKKHDKFMEKLYKDRAKEMKKEGGIFTKLAKILNQNTIDALVTAGVPFGQVIRPARGALRVLGGLQQGKGFSELLGLPPELGLDEALGLSKGEATPGTGGGKRPIYKGTKPAAKRPISTTTGKAAPFKGGAAAKGGASGLAGMSTGVVAALGVVAGIVAGILAVVYLIYKLLQKSEAYQAVKEATTGYVVGILDTIIVTLLMLYQWFMEGPLVSAIKEAAYYASETVATVKEARAKLEERWDAMATKLEEWKDKVDGWISAVIDKLTWDNFKDGVTTALSTLGGIIMAPWVERWNTIVEIKDRLIRLLGNIEGILSPEYWASTPFAQLFSGEFDLSKYNIVNKFDPTAIFDRVKKWDISISDLFSIKDQFSVSKLFDLTKKFDLDLKELFGFTNKFSVKDMFGDFSKEVGSAVSGALESVGLGGLF